MKQIAVIGANDFQNRLIKRAQEMGYFVHAFAWQCGDIGEHTANRFYPISITEKEAILKVCRQIGIDGICSIASDLAVNTVNYVAQELGLCGNPVAITQKCTNKYSMRNAFYNAGIPVPQYIRVSSGFNGDIGCLTYPVIVKPTDRSGSRGITLVNTHEELADAVGYATANSFEGQAIIEEYIDGQEYSCEGITYNGVHTLLAFTKKTTTNAPHFIETGHCQPSGLTAIQRDRFSVEIKRALDALGIRYGASHTEFRVTADGNLRIIEIGARMGGDCIGSDLVPLSSGYDYIRMVIDTATGNAPDFSLIHSPRPVEIRFLFNKNDMDNMYKRIGEGLSIYRVAIANDCDSKTTVTNSAERLGYYIYYLD